MYSWNWAADSRRQHFRGRYIGWRMHLRGSNWRWLRNAGENAGRIAREDKECFDWRSEQGEEYWHFEYGCPAEALFCRSRWSSTSGEGTELFIKIPRKEQDKNVEDQGNACWWWAIYQTGNADDYRLGVLWLWNCRGSGEWDAGIGNAGWRGNRPCICGSEDAEDVRIRADKGGAGKGNGDSLYRSYRICRFLLCAGSAAPGGGRLSAEADSKRGIDRHTGESEGREREEPGW